LSGRSGPTGQQQDARNPAGSGVLSDVSDLSGSAGGIRRRIPAVGDLWEDA